MGDLEERIRRARAAWPGVAVEEAQLTAWLDERVADRGQLGDLALEDLYLACAVAHGDAEALRSFESQLAADLEVVTRHLRLQDDLRDEVAQLVRAKILVGPPPRIADYSGRGALRSWLRAVATRTALDLLRARSRQPRSEAEILSSIPAAIDDPETALLRRRYAAELADTLREAFAALSPRERLLLKRHFVDGLGTDELGTLYRVHRVTTLRWLTRALNRLAARSQKLLIQRLDLPTSQYDSIVRLVRSQLDLSLGQLLAADPSLRSP